MNLETLLSKEQLYSDDFTKYISYCGGIEKVRKKNLNKIFKKFGYNYLLTDVYFSIYKMVSDNENGKIITIWTWVVGIATLICMAFTIVGYFKSS